MNTYLRNLCILAFSFTLAAGAAYAEEEATTSSTYLEEGSSYTLDEVTDDSVASDTDMIITDYLTGTTYRVVVNSDDDGGNLYYYYSWQNLATDAVGSLLTSTMSEPDSYDFKIDYGSASVIQGSTTNISLTVDNFSSYASLTFVGNNSTTVGGAIIIEADLSELGDDYDLTGSFIGNTSIGAASSGGSAINIAATGVFAGDITGDFIGNSFNTDVAYSGGAIANLGTLSGDITGNFIENSVNYSNGQGGAIYNANSAVISGEISADFYNNSALLGGAIYNQGAKTSIGLISGDISGVFSGNTAGTSGGAIYNRGNITGDITADFYGNTALTNGGAIYNDSTAYSGGNSDYVGISGNITGTFDSNSAASGGAIYNAAIIGSEAIYLASQTDPEVANTVISGDFTDNSATNGGAIYNSGIIYSDITSDFTDNSATNGGAIYNAGDIYGDITGTFTGNSTSGKGGLGGAIYNIGDIYGDITGDFIGNYTIGNYGEATAIYNSGTIYGDITGDFIGNYASGNNSNGAIFNTADGVISGELTGDFTSNYSRYNGAAINNSGTIYAVTGSFTGNTNTGAGGGNGGGGAIENLVGGTISFYTLYNDIELVGNTSALTSKGTENTAGITATTYNAISNGGILNLNAYGDYSITFNDSISNPVASTSGTLNVNNTLYEDGSYSYSSVVFNNQVFYQDVTVYNGTLELGSYAGGDSYLNYNESTITTVASSFAFYDSSLTLDSNATLSLKVSASSDAAVNKMVFSATTLDLSAGNAALDLSEIYGDFTLTLTFGQYDDATELNTMYSFLTGEDGLDVIFADYTIYDVVATDDKYVVTSGDDILAEFTVTQDTDNYIITIDGESFVVVVPEPSTYAMIVGLFALAFAYYRRRKQ